MDNLLKIYADIENKEPSKEMASALSIPASEERQPDLQYITAVFVSSGFNLNSAYFLPSELILAKDTIIEKPLDVDHVQDKIVGHLYSSAFANKDGSVFDPIELYKTMGTEIDSVPMDIVTAMRLYKVRFPDVASDVEEGKYKVSMECYYKDFDIIVDDIIIPKVEAEVLGLVNAVNKKVRVVEGEKAKGKHRVGRVLRGMLFSGCGLVENPANPESIILETAAKIDNKYILDLTKVDSYMKAKQEKEAVVIHSLEGVDKDLAYLSASYGGSHRHEVPTDKAETFLDGGHNHVVMPDNLPDKVAVFFVHDGGHRHSFNSKSGKIGPEKDHTHKVYIEKPGGFKAIESGPAVKGHTHELTAVDANEDYDYKTDKTHLSKGEDMGETSYGGSHYHVIELEEGIKLKTVVPTDILKMESSMGDIGKKEDAYTRDGHPLSKPDICVSFKKRVYEKGGDDPGKPSNADKTPGLVPQVESLPAPGVGGEGGDAITQNDTVIHENWCVLFDEACNTPGGMAVHPDCWRLILDRTTKEVVTDYYKKVQVNRKTMGIKEALTSLSSVLDKAGKIV
jgi:hypothetical protein